MPVISVVICTNRIDDFFYRAIDSILNQEFKSIEIILVLNGEATKSLNILVDRFDVYSQIRVIGTSIAYLNHSLNLGIENALGKYIARMDADDIAYPDRLAIQFEFLEKHPEIAVCGTWFSLIDSKDAPFELVKLPIDDAAIRRSAFMRNPMCHPTVMFRRDIVGNAGGYLGGLYAEDYDLWLRLMATPGVLFANIPQVLLGYRAIPGGMARRSALAYASVAGAQWGSFVRSGDPRWLLAALLTCVKRWLFARR